LDFITRKIDVWNEIWAFLIRLDWDGGKSTASSKHWIVAVVEKRQRIIILTVTTFPSTIFTLMTLNHQSTHRQK